MGTTGHKYQAVPLSEINSTGDMKCNWICCPVVRCVFIALYKRVKRIRNGWVPRDCWECLAIIFACFWVKKCLKFLRDCLGKSNSQKNPQTPNNELHSITIEQEDSEVHRLRKEIEHKDNTIHELHQQNRKAAQDKLQAEAEKQNALTRLSELMSVKLRDNNPNIADLNDLYRPTKLAEMFSELYDNEWTALYTILENSKFKDRHMISFLLDVFMVSFTFCQTELDANWQLVSKWYLDDNVPNNQAVKKALKDRRKLFVPRLLPEMENKLNTLLCGLCKLENLQFVLSSGEMKEYVAACVKLSLLMNANDPPVAIDCPGWVPCISQKESIYQPKHEEESDLLTHEGNAQIPSNVEGDGSNKHNTSDLKERRTFNKELFKEYTVRGKYVEFFVWPVMYLHENGPVLAKGIAQGAEDKVISDDDHRWEWW